MDNPPVQLFRLPAGLLSRRGGVDADLRSLWRYSARPSPAPIRAVTEQALPKDEIPPGWTGRVPPGMAARAAGDHEHDIGVPRQGVPRQGVPRQGVVVDAAPWSNVQ